MRNILLFFFILIQGIFAALGVLKTDAIRSMDTTTAYGFHLALTFCFVLGYILFILLVKNIERGDRKDLTVHVISGNYFYFSLILVFTGLITSVGSVLSVTDMKHYFTVILQKKDEVIEIKDAVGTSGLPGYIKMFNYAPLGVFLVNASVLSFLDVRPLAKKKLFLITMIAFLGAMIKVIFSFERLTLLAIAGVLLYIFLISSKRIKLYSMGGMLVLLGVLYFVTSTKMKGMSIIDFLILYVHLGLANFELLIAYFNEWTYGMNAFFMPLYFIGKTFGVDIEVAQAPVAMWGGPQYFFGYLYMDFGYFSFIVAMLLGFLLALFQRSVNQKNIWAIGVFFLMLFLILSTMVIPVSRATEFWLMIVIALVSVFWVKKLNIVSL